VAIPGLQPRQCTVNTDCPTAGYVCETNTCGGTFCARPCTMDTCTGVNECVNDKCVPKRCDAPGATPCGDAAECKPGDPNASQTGCVPLRCGTALKCQDGYDCTTTGAGNGCVQRTCAADGDCSCGYCVNSRCEATLGYCYEIIAMPYGCVWPDEELV
jgi:hypothetical protein